MNTFLKYLSPARQFLAFLGLAAFFFLVSIVVSSFFFSDIAGVLTSNTEAITPVMLNRFKWAQVVSTIAMFVMPAGVFAYISSPQPLAYAGLQKHVSVTLFILSIVLLFVIQPFADLLGQLNAKANFGMMHQALKDAEALYTKALQTFLQMKTPGDLLLNLFVMALLPAFAEELYFRASLQKVLLRWTKIPWLSIFIASLIFAVLHGTAFKFLPIFALGIMLGTVYYATGNLWYSITIHFINNAFAVLVTYFADRSEIMKRLADDSVGFSSYTAIISLIISAGIIYFMWKKSKTLLPAYAADDDDNDYIA